MIEVFQMMDIANIGIGEVKDYLYRRFKEIGYELDPQREGYFVYVDDFSMLYEHHHLTYFTLPSLDEGLLNCIEAIDREDDLVEVSLLFNNEFLISLVFYKLQSSHLHILQKEVKI
jgi:hypothetical protein